MNLCTDESEEHNYGFGDDGVYYSDVRYTIVSRSHRISRKVKRLVAKKNHGPVYMKERGS